MTAVVMLCASHGFAECIVHIGA